jgi:hypothetical protein
LWYAGTDGTSLSWESEGGICSEHEQAARVRVTLPEIAMPMPALVTDYTISGAEISLAPSGRGTVLWSGADADLFVYDADPCDDCADSQWYALRALIRDSEAGTLTAAKLFLDEEDEDVTIYQSVTLPGFFLDSRSFLPATFTAP